MTAGEITVIGQIYLAGMLTAGQNSFQPQNQPVNRTNQWEPDKHKVTAKVNWPAKYLFGFGKWQEFNIVHVNNDWITSPPFIIVNLTTKTDLLPDFQGCCICSLESHQD